MKAAVITIAGISSRFNAGMPEEEKRHKSIYYENDPRNTLLYHLLEKCKFADRIVIVGGNKFREVEEYCSALPDRMKDKILLIYNSHYFDLASGYSFYVGLKELFDKVENLEEVLFVEGDLDIDHDSFDRVVSSPHDVLTYSYEPIYADKAVVLYRDAEGHYKYTFNSSHGLLLINEAFSVILNSGQLWKFRNPQKLKYANERFFEKDKAGTNLNIIQNYLDSCESESFEIIGLKRWTNCNTREDYQRILKYWEVESE